jgi:hypothetical protein
MATATKRDPAKWARAKAKAKAKMGGKHSARAMQLAVKYYKDMGGSYSGPKKKTSLSHWSKQKWKYSGKDKPGPGGTGVYLPSKKIDSLKSSSSGKAKLREAAAKKRAATSAGRQYSKHGLASGTSYRKKK